MIRKAETFVLVEEIVVCIETKKMNMFFFVSRYFCLGIYLYFIFFVLLFTKGWFRSFEHKDKIEEDYFMNWRAV